MQVRQLQEDDDRSAFDCGVESMNTWLRKTAGQHQRKGLSRTYAAIEPRDIEKSVGPDNPEKIVGYFALAASQVETDGMAAARLPRSVSAVLPARLAVDVSHQGQGLGEHLLMAAFDTVITTARIIGVQCVVVDAVDAKAAAFYGKYGFVPLTNAPLRLFLPVETIAQA